MVKLLFVSAFFSLFPFFSSGQSAEKEVHQAIVGFFDGLSARDVSVSAKHTTADFLLIEDGEVWTLDTLAARISQFKPESYSRVNKFKFIRTDITGSQAWVAYHNTADIRVNGRDYKVEWMESVVVVKTDKGWLLKMMHSTHLEPPKK